MTFAQIAAIISLLVAFGVPQDNIDRVQSILNATQYPATTPQDPPPASGGNQSTNPVTPPSGGNIIVDMPQETPAPTCTIGGHLEFDSGGTVVGKITWISTDATAGSVLIQQPSSPSHISRVLGPIQGGTLPAGFTVSNGDIGLNLTAHISGPSGTIVCEGTVPGLDWSLPIGQYGDYTLNGETRSCQLTSSGLMCIIKDETAN